MKRKINKLVKLLKHCNPKLIDNQALMECNCADHKCWEDLKNLYIELCNIPINKIKAEESTQPYFDNFQNVMAFQLEQYHIKKNLN